jgi:hypothetical protein
MEITPFLDRNSITATAPNAATSQVSLKGGFHCREFSLAGAATTKSCGLRPLSSATCDKRIAAQASQRDKLPPAAEVLGLSDSSDDAPNAATRQACLKGDFQCRAFSLTRANNNPILRLRRVDV